MPGCRLIVATTRARSRPWNRESSTPTAAPNTPLSLLLQREGKHAEAIKHFRAALRKRPNFGVWWVGLGISLQATNQPAAALDAFRRAKAGGNLHPHVAALADERLKQLQ